jgi:hypothetical protein
VAAIETAVAEVETPDGVGDRRGWLAGAFPRIANPTGPQTRWGEIGLGAWRARVLARLCAAPGDAIVFTHFIAMNAAISAALGVDDTIVAWPGHCGVAELRLVAGRLVLVSGPGGAAASEVR